MQAANIKYILGYDGGVLNCYSKIQKSIVDEYNTKSFEELKDIVIDIIEKRDINGNIQKVRKVQRLKDEAKKKKERDLQQQKDDDAMWRRMGKDPAKMRKVNRTDI